MRAGESRQELEVRDHFRSEVGGISLGLSERGACPPFANDHVASRSTSPGQLTRTGTRRKLCSQPTRTNCRPTSFGERGAVFVVPAPFAPGRRFNKERLMSNAMMQWTQRRW